MKSPIISIVFLLTISLDLVQSKFFTKNLLSFGTEDEIATITKDDESALREALNTLNNKGGTIYIDTPVINIKKKKNSNLLDQIQEV